MNKAVVTSTRKTSIIVSQFLWYEVEIRIRDIPCEMMTIHDVIDWFDCLA